MIRRRFLGLVTLAGAGGLTTLSRASTRPKETLTFKIQGFTCVTCAVGLETLLMREKGVVAAKATYPEALATIIYDPASTSKETIAAVIESMGFHARPIVPPSNERPRSE